MAFPSMSPTVPGTPQAWMPPVLPQPVPAFLRTTHPFAKAFACALVLYLVATALLMTVLLGKAPTDATAWQVGYVIGQSIGWFLLASLLAGLLSGLFVRLSSRVWPGWQIAALVLAMFFLVVALQLLAGLAG